MVAINYIPKRKILHNRYKLNNFDWLFEYYFSECRSDWEFEEQKTDMTYKKTKCQTTACILRSNVKNHTFENL